MTRFLSIAVAVVVSMGVLAGVADPHSTSWIWAVSAAEAAVEDRYEDGDDTVASCRGTGRSSRLKNGKRGYKHFYCGVAWSDDEEEDGIATNGGVLHVTGKNGFRFVWDE